MISDIQTIHCMMFVVIGVINRNDIKTLACSALSWFPSCFFCSMSLIYKMVVVGQTNHSKRKNELITCRSIFLSFRIFFCKSEMIYTKNKYNWRQHHIMLQDLKHTFTHQRLTTMCTYIKEGNEWAQITINYSQLKEQSYFGS